MILNWLRSNGVSIFRLTVTNWRLARICCPSPSKKSKNSTAALGCGALRARACAVARATAGGSTNQSSGAPFKLGLLGEEAVDRERERHRRRRPGW